MLAVVSGLFFYKNIARHLSRKFAKNRRKYKADFIWWFPTYLNVFMICETNHSHQFCYLIKKKMPGWYSKWRERWWQEDAWRMNGQFILHSFINIVHFSIFVDKSWFKVINLFICISIHAYFQSGLTANKCCESSKLTKKLVDSAA